jgi:hypothetical protein
MDEFNNELNSSQLHSTYETGLSYALMQLLLLSDMNNITELFEKNYHRTLRLSKDIK